MAIVYDSDNQTISIHTDHSTYQMMIGRYGHLLHLHYGERTDACRGDVLTLEDRGFSGNPYDAGEDRTYSLDSLPQEFPVQGSGDYRSPMLVVRDSAGVYGCDLRYKSHEITPGKYRLDGLPAVYAEATCPEAAGGHAEGGGAQTLCVVLANDRTGVEVTLLYGVLPSLDIVTRAAVVTNRGERPVTVERLGSANLDFTAGDYELVTFYGRHCGERTPERRPLAHGETVIGSRRGISSHQFNPMVILTEPQTRETRGRCWSMQFVYSGGFRASAGLDQYGQTRLQMGLANEKFSYPLAPGESLTAPEVIMSFSDTGLETLSHHLHKCIREHVCRGRWRDGGRPLLLNSWEAAYFDFTGETILALADEAKALGIDLIVLDDGWFGRRSDDLRSLGDWYPNEEKLGCPLKELIRKVNGKGVRFGIWVEPEMVSENSDLYRAHPDWALAIPGEHPVRARYQLVLDLSRGDVADAVYESLCGILDQGSVEYLKWDCNRAIAEACSAAADDQGKVLYDYMLGLYGILERIVRRYPDLLIEGCCGGGGRFDAGMLSYTPQIWCSDNTDALERVMIQYGTSFGYPASAVGAHVSACPNHQTGRTVPLKTRGVVAMSGTFGYELDPAALTGEEREEVKRQIADHRRYRDLIHGGLYYRLSDPAADDIAAWEFAAEDGSRVLLCAVRMKDGQPQETVLKLRGLKAGARYCESDTGRTFTAEELAEVGYRPDLGSAPGDSCMACFERK